MTSRTGVWISKRSPSGVVKVTPAAMQGRLGSEVSIRQPSRDPRLRSAHPSTVRASRPIVCVAFWSEWSRTSSAARPLELSQVCPSCRWGDVEAENLGGVTDDGLRIADQNLQMPNGVNDMRHCFLAKGGRTVLRGHGHVIGKISEVGNYFRKKIYIEI